MPREKRMARKRRARPPSPSPPPPTPPREDSISEEEEEEAAAAAVDATLATQNAPQNPNPPSTDVPDADSSEESSDSDTDANAFQLREVARSPRKPSESDANEEDGSSSDSPEPVQKKAKRKPKVEAGKKKRQAAEFGPSGGGKAKKAKADVEKTAPLSVSGKAPSEPNASSKGNKKQKGKAVPDRSPSKAAARRWTIEDEIKVLEAVASHIKANGTQPSALEIIAAVGDSLERGICSKTEMYEKVRHLMQRHEKAVSAGTVPGNDDDLGKFNLSEAVWGGSAKEVAAAHIVQTDGVSSKIKKGQTNKEKADDHSKEANSTVNENVGTLLAESDKGQATKEKADGDTNGRLSKKAATTDTSVESKKHNESHNEELGDGAKAGTTKETTGTDGGKCHKEKIDGDAESLGPKDARAVTQNDDTDLALSKNGETHEEKMGTDPNVKNMRRGFDELQSLYPNLATYVESIQAHHPCGETLKRAFEFIADEKACALESKIKKQAVAEMKMEIRQADTKKEVTNIFIGLLD